MSSPAECTILGLEHKFTEQPSVNNSVQTIGGEIMRIEKAIWIASPVLRDHLEHGNSYKTLNASKNCVEALCEAHKYGTFPPDFKSSLNLLALSSELELRSLTTKCFETLQKTEALYELDYPAECSIETMMRCFRVFLDGPLRTENIYEQQLNRIARHCSNDPHVMSNAINLVKQMLEKYINRSLEGIPVGFDRAMVPVVILERNGKRQTAIIKDSELRLVNLFGEHFNLSTVEVDDSFYLKHGSYLLYQSGEFVYYKDLRNDSEPIEKLNSCTISITRATFVFAVRNEGDRYSISLWTNDEKFVTIHQFTKQITMLEFDFDKRVLAVILEKTKLLFFRLEHDTLFLLHRDFVPALDSILLSEEDKFYVVKTDNGLTFETYRAPILNGEASDRAVDAKADDGVESETWKSSDEGYYIDFFCGDHYFFENRCLEILQNFPSRYPARPLLAEGELCSISELWLLP